MRRLLFAALILASPLLAGRSRADEFALSYRLSPMIESEVVNPGGAACVLSPRAPWPVEQNPAGATAAALFGRVADQRMAVLDKSAPDSTTWDLLWVDANGDGRIEASERFALTPAGAVVALEFDRPDGRTRQHFRMTLAQAPGETRLIWTSCGYYVGRARFGEKSYRVALVDFNANGRFNDAPAEEETGDRLLIDTNDDGVFDLRPPREEELSTLSKYVRVDGSYWAVAAAPDGGTLSVDSAKVATGRLQVNEQSLNLTVFGPNGRLALNRAEGQEPFTLPAGTYRVQYVRVDRADDRGRTWTLRSVGGKGASFEVKDGEETRLAVGAPLTAAASSTPLPDGAIFTLAFSGVDGLTYEQPRPTRLAVPVPGLTVKTPDGAWQKRYLFEFG